MVSRFASTYGVHMHRNHRSGPTEDSLPAIEECDAMISSQQRVMDCLRRIRQVVADYAAATAEQKREERRQNMPSEYEDDAASSYDKLDGAGAYAAPDSKKRRGVMTPPLIAIRFDLC